MGLVDYDSDGSGTSDEEVARQVPAKAVATPATGAKKPFQKLVDRANPGKILVNLPSTAAAVSGEQDGDARPEKRARIDAGGSSRFSGFGSFLPPPKNAAASSAKPANSSLPQPDVFSSSSSSFSSRQGTNLKTSSEAAFSRRDTTVSGASDATAPANSGSLASNSNASAIPKAPFIPADQKSAEDVKLVGNPLMFLPLSVSRKPGTKKKKAVGRAGEIVGIPQQSAKVNTAGQTTTSIPSETLPLPPPKTKKLSLFSLGADDQVEAEQIMEDEDASADHAAATNEYSSTYQVAQPEESAYDGQPIHYTGDAATQAAADTLSLNTIADDLHLSAKERRELFGRTGAVAASTRIAANFNMDQEYRHNEALRRAEEASANGGQQQSHNPVRTLMPGKHSLRQLVNAVHTQQDALEETFAKNRQSQREAGGKYGWR
ncbi:hypothetical protein SEPCBS119000_006264 [Sporothrix epigloea]|uniref:Stress activated map kinase interacting n=1 Tax=Sporothrix epigloea TaxID=1892477 RepID=A0ABP0E589_9PEZI